MSKPRRAILVRSLEDAEKAALWLDLPQDVVARFIIDRCKGTKLPFFVVDTTTIKTPHDLKYGVAHNAETFTSSMKWLQEHHYEVTGIDKNEITIDL